jgi:hypothetical protein
MIPLLCNVIDRLVSQLDGMQRQRDASKERADRADALVEAYRQARSDAMDYDVDLAEKIIEIESMDADDYIGITPDRAYDIAQALIAAATKNAQERNKLAAKLVDWDMALERSCMDMSLCRRCGETVICLPDGLSNVCGPCSEMENATCLPNPKVDLAGASPAQVKRVVGCEPSNGEMK